MPKKRTLEEFIQLAKLIHGNKYEYDSVIYKNNNVKVNIYCKKHKKLFYITPNSHLANVGCKSCGIESAYNIRRKTKETFVKQAILIHGDKYNYKKTEYIIGNQKVIIFCKKHQEIFYQTPDVHIKGFGCGKCSTEKRRNVNEFIEKSKKIHGDKYDYSNVKYNGARVKVDIICKKHNISFSQLPSSHTRGNGCNLCGRESFVLSKKSNTNEFIRKAKLIHGEKYNYDSVLYKKDCINVKIFCNTHGIYFMQRASSHLKGVGCIKCRDKKMASTSDIFIEKAKLIHGKKYSYDSVLYKNNSFKVKIFCIKHESYFTQTPANQLNGKGCPKCSESTGEKVIAQILDRLYISYEREKRFKSCRSKNELPFDFYINNINLCIEFDGIQHEIPLSCFGGESMFIELQKRDKIKTDWCKKNGVNLLRINYKDFDKIEQILTKELNK